MRSARKRQANPNKPISFFSRPGAWLDCQGLGKLRKLSLMRVQCNDGTAASQALDEGPIPFDITTAAIPDC